MPMLIAVVFLVLLQSPATQRPAPAASGTDNSQEAFVIEQMVTRYRFESDGTGRRETQARLKIQSEAGVQMWGQLVFGYDSGTERLEIQHVRVRKADGTVITAPPDSVQDLTSPVQQLAPVYTDFKQKHVTVPGLRPGETLEYSIASTIHTPLAAGHFWAEYDFENEAVMLDEQVEFDLPASRAVILNTAADAEPHVSEQAGRKVYRWRHSHPARAPQKDDATLRAEAEAEAENPRRAAVRLTTFQSWEDVGRWYVELERGPRTVTAEIRQKAQQLTAGQKTDMEKLEALYDFVGPGFRYVSISLGMGRYQPRAAADVLRDQYGDCKDKHTLLASLMEATGLRASTVLINSDSKIDPAFPSPSQFDHAITFARIDSTDVWLDVTTEVAPFRLLSPNLRKKEALVVSAGDGSRIIETPAAPPTPNVVTQEITGTLGELGAFKGSIKLAVRGDVELLLRTIFRRTPAANWKEVVEGFNKTAGIGGDVGDWKVSDPAATHQPFTIEYSASRTGYVDWTKKTAALKLPFASITLPAPADTRDKPIDLGARARVEYRLDLTLGPGYQARAPLPVSVTREYGVYTSTYALEGQRFRAHRQLELLTGSIPAANAGDFGSFRRTVIADYDQTLSLDITATVPTAAPVDMKAPELIRSGYDAIQNRSYDQAVVLLTRALELEPKDTKGWNYLGDAYVALRRYADALAAYGEQLKVNPYDEFVHNDIGYVYRLQRRYADAEAEYRKQLELNPLDKYAHKTLGGLLVDMEKYEAAVPQLERAISLAPEDSELRIDLGTAYLNLSKDDQALAAFTKAVELAPSPTAWNNISYQLALKAVHLDRALQYAESAVGAAAAASRNLTVDHVSARELAVVRSLASYWDTLGWVHFAKGDLPRAERLVRAAWFLEQTAEVGDHLGQIYEKQGKRAEAIRMYAMALNSDGATDHARIHLAALAGGDAAAAVAMHKHDLLNERTLPLDAPKGLTGMADFVVLIGEDALPQGVRFVNGKEKLRPLADAIRKVRFGPPLPDGAPARIIRRGTASCTASGCSFVLFPASHAQPVQ